MSRFRAYINPRDDAGNFTGYQEVTEDVNLESMGEIQQQIDNDEYSVGLFRFNDFSLKFRNEHGRYSDVDVVESMFRFRRSGSKFKLTWEGVDDGPQCGLAVAGASHGATLNDITDVFIGVISDEATKLDIDDQRISFRVLSTDSTFLNVTAPFASFSIGQLYSDAIFAALNQSEITEYLTVSALNINVGLDQTFDSVSEFENKTVKEFLDEVLFQSNSVLYIKDETIFVASRDGGLTSQFTFRGQASNEGIEDIIKISDVNTGLNNVFNYWTWKDTTLLKKDDASITTNGVRKREVDLEGVTSTAKREAVLEANKEQFKLKKQTFNLTVAITGELLKIPMLSQVRVDYPTTFTPAEVGGEIPIYGLAIYGEDRYPFGQFSITINKDVPYKIIGINIITKTQQIKFKIKEI